MRRSLHRLLVLLAGALFYLLLFPVPTRKELAIDRRWAATVTAEAPLAAAATGSLADSIPFAFPDAFGYLDQEGALRFRAPVSYGVAISEEGFVSYGRVPEQLVIQQPDGRYQATVAVAGYPYYAGGQLYVTDGGGSVVDCYEASGNHLWTIELPGSVSVIDGQDGFGAVGMLAGGVAVVQSDGRQLTVDGTGNSFATVVYGIAVDAAEGRVAAATGPTDPAVVVYARQEERMVPTLRIDLESTPGGPIVLEFVNGGEELVVDDGESARIISSEDGSSVTVPLSNQLRVVSENRNGLMVALSRSNAPDPQRGFRTPAELVFFDAPGSVPVRTVFAADHTFLHVAAEGSVLGLDGRVLRFRVGSE